MYVHSQLPSTIQPDWSKGKKLYVVIDHFSEKSSSKKKKTSKLGQSKRKCKCSDIVSNASMRDFSIKSCVRANYLNNMSVSWTLPVRHLSTHLSINNVLDMNI